MGNRGDWSEFERYKQKQQKEIKKMNYTLLFRVKMERIQCKYTVSEMKCTDCINNLRWCGVLGGNNRRITGANVFLVKKWGQIGVYFNIQS
jgi:hypothetical protein